MPTEPQVKCVVTFVDGQTLYYAARVATVAAEQLKTVVTPTGTAPERTDRQSTPKPIADTVART
jgi:hypothetical protein